MSRSSTQSNHDDRFISFSDGIIDKAISRIDRAICFIWYRRKTLGQDSQFSDIINDFNAAGLSKPNTTHLKEALRKDSRVTKSGKNTWRIRADRVKKLEEDFTLNSLINIKPRPKIRNPKYIHEDRLSALRAKKSSIFDFSRLIRMLEEINANYESGNYISTILLLRAILDHVPPVFSCSSFTQVANNYAGSKSFKEAMKSLEESSRKISDGYLHVQIRNKEILPNETQVDFSPGLDLLLAEIIRIAK